MNVMMTKRDSYLESAVSPSFYSRCDGTEIPNIHRHRRRMRLSAARLVVKHDQK